MLAGWLVHRTGDGSKPLIKSLFHRTEMLHSSKSDIFSNYFPQNTAFSPLFSPRDLCSLRRFAKITTFSVVSNHPLSCGPMKGR